MNLKADPLHYPVKKNLHIVKQNAALLCLPATSCLPLQKSDSNRKMFVGGLPRNCSEDTLFSAMEKLFGRVSWELFYINTYLTKNFSELSLARNASRCIIVQIRAVYYG